MQNENVFRVFGRTQIFEPRQFAYLRALRPDIAPERTGDDLAFAVQKEICISERLLGHEAAC